MRVDEYPKIFARVQCFDSCCSYKPKPISWLRCAMLPDGIVGRKDVHV